MGVAGLWLRIDLRRRWRRHLALALLVAVVVGPVLTCAAGARRTVSAFSRFANAQDLPDVELTAQVDHAHLEALGQLPGAVAAGTYMPFFAAPSGRHLAPGQDFLVFAASDSSYARTVDRPLLTAGRLPDPTRADEVLADTKTAAQLHLHVGDQLTLDSITPKQYDAIQQGATAQDVTFDGPHPTVRVVGIGVTRLDIGVGYATSYFVATPAFAAAQAEAMASFGELLDVRLRDGARGIDAYGAAAEQAAGPQAGLTKGTPQHVLRAARDSASVQGVALLLVGLLAALAGAVAIGQSVGRALAADAVDRGTLAMLGLDRGAMVRLVVAAFMPSAVLGAAIGATAAWLASSLFPTGLARVVEVSPGRDLDPAILLGGAAAFVLVVAARAAIGARRLRERDDRPPAAAPLLTRVGRALPSAEATGLRWALPRRGVAARASARAGLVGFIVGVAGLCAALSYGGGINRLVSTPSAYGWTFDADAGGGQDPDAVGHVRDVLSHDAAIAELATLHITPHATVGGRSMQVFAFSPLRGSFAVTVIRGRAPAAPDEVLLGPASAAALHVGIGSTVPLESPAGPTPLRIVGLGLFPNIETDGFASGAQVTEPTYKPIAGDDSYDDIVVRWAPGIDVPATVERLSTTSFFGQVAAPPPDIANLGNVRRYPALLSGFVALLALLSALHALVVSVRRRRRELGVLRALGFTRNQMTRALIAHGLTLAGLGIVIGAPLGIALGRALWHIHADRLHVAVVEDVPYAHLVGACGLGIVLVALIAAIIGQLVSRRSAAATLRAD